MKIRTVVTIVGLTIGFALPASPKSKMRLIQKCVSRSRR